MFEGVATNCKMTGARSEQGKLPYTDLQNPGNALFSAWIGSGALPPFNGPNYRDSFLQLFSVAVFRCFNSWDQLCWRSRAPCPGVRKNREPPSQGRLETTKNCNKKLLQKTVARNWFIRLCGVTVVPLPSP